LKQVAKDKEREGSPQLLAGDIHMEEREMADPADLGGCSPPLNYNQHEEKLVNLTGSHGETC
jgi:hypothetical protein